MSASFPYMPLFCSRYTPMVKQRSSYTLQDIDCHAYIQNLLKCFAEMSTTNSDDKVDGAIASSVPCNTLSKDDTKESGKETEQSAATVDAELDVGSESFNPLRVLYEKDVRISKNPPPVEYQNIAAFESALKRLGVWGLQQKPNKSGKAETSGSQSQKTIITEERVMRRFLPHQMPIKAPMGTGQRHFKNLWNAMDKMEGPLRMLSDSVKMQRRVHVVVRNEHGVRGHMEGNLISFDKHWNLLLSNVKEVWRRRKFKYGVNKTCEAGNPTVDCTQRLASLGITLPQQSIKSLDRKNVEITRALEQLVIRGEQIVLVNILASKITTTQD